MTKLGCQLAPENWQERKEEGELTMLTELLQSPASCLPPSLSPTYLTSLASA